jgi:hypothetical protein
VLLIVTGVGSFVSLIANVTENFVARRNSINRAQKRNMLIGQFFNEFATDLLRQCVAAGQAVQELRLLTWTVHGTTPDIKRLSGSSTL